MSPLNIERFDLEHFAVVDVDAVTLSADTELDTGVQIPTGKAELGIQPGRHLELGEWDVDHLRAPAQRRGAGVADERRWP